MDLKRNLDEIMVIYALEPELRDIFVEGLSDKLFIEWYLGKKGIENISVYPIEFVEIPTQVLEKHALTNRSNRSRVIVLSYELTERQSMCRGVLCLVDRDYEDCCPNVKPNSYLVFTDVNSLEAYALFPSVVEKFLLVALGGFPLSKRTVMDVIDRILTRLYAIRVTNERLGWGMSWIPFTRYVSLTKESIALREADFLRSYLQKNHRWDSSKEFAAALSETTAQLPTDIGRRIRGHDLADLMLLLVNRFRKERKFGNVETIEGSLLATIEAADLDDSVLFRRIVALGQEGQG